MKRGYATSELRQTQVELGAKGAEIFHTATTALASNMRGTYEGKPLDCLVFHFDRTYIDCQSPTMPDEMRSESLDIRLTDPERIDEYEYTGNKHDVFLHHSVPGDVIDMIREGISNASHKTLGGGENQYYHVPAYAITTQYKVKYRSGHGASVDTATYKPRRAMLIAANVFATDVLKYMQTEIYRKFPFCLPSIERKEVAEAGGMNYGARISFAARPPLNGKEPKEWLEKYANWLRQTIEEMTLGPDELDDMLRFRFVTDVAMGDGIMLIETLEAIRRME